NLSTALVLRLIELGENLDELAAANSSTAHGLRAAGPDELRCLTEDQQEALRRLAAELRWKIEEQR
ncbi:MAG: hypothetical protein WDA16_05845, partial [Candidatus Thermoplasmatota archaeon]